MMMDHSEVNQDLPSPDLPELLQREDDPLLVLPVRPVEPVLTHELPSRHAACFTQNVGTTAVKVLSGPDPKRKRVLLTFSGAGYIATTLNTGAGALIPAATTAPVEIRHQGDVVVRAVADTINVGVIVETYAD